jgi:hypothetical protein
MLSMRCALRVDATRATRFLGQRPRTLLLLTLRPRQPDVGDGVLLELIARAAEREGGLTAYGPPDFQFRIARVAGANHLAVSFADAELEKARQAAQAAAPARVNKAAAGVYYRAELKTRSPRRYTIPPALAAGGRRRTSDRKQWDGKPGLANYTRATATAGAAATRHHPHNFVCHTIQRHVQELER